MALPILARVRSPSSARGVEANKRLIRDSILTHLRVMCATRLGSMATRPDYGLPDVSELVHSFPDAASVIARALRHTIEKYEPRLRDVRVDHVPHAALDLIIRFEISALIAVERAAPVRFETRIDASRRVSVE